MSANHKGSKSRVEEPEKRKRKKSQRAVVGEVAPGSPAEELGIVPGDVILSINGVQIRDEIDYIYASGGEDTVTAEWEDANGDTCVSTIPLDDSQEDFGVTIAPAPVAVCENRCLFCFVDQMPRGMRKTLYIKDDDWHSSFWHGTYITLTNLDEGDMQRIIEQRISPLYVSVHATDDDVRAKLLGTPKGRGTFRLLKRLVHAGIEIEAQAVICEGINDGEVLSQTIEDLGALCPKVRSLSIVPVGLTCHRNGLPDVKPVSAENAGRIIDIVEEKQREFLRKKGTRFVFAADELYLRSGREIPEAEAYEDFEQLDNGIGLVADFEANAKRALKEAAECVQKRDNPYPAPHVRKVLLVTGEAFAPRLERLAVLAQEAANGEIEVTVRPVKNRFFGPAVTVSGLLTGKDVIAAVPDAGEFDFLFLPDAMFRDDALGYRTLDDITLDEMRAAIGIPCFKASPQGDEFIRQLVRCP